MENIREIGGYFGLDVSLQRAEYHKHALGFNLARSALEFLLIQRKIKRIFLPDFTCKVVFDACRNAGTEIQTYKIGADFAVNFKKNVEKNDCVYIVNYFGQLSENEIIGYKEKFGNVILDNVQAFFSHPVKGIDTLYSCRKFFGVPDGSYLYTDTDFETAYERLPEDNSADRYRHIIGRTDTFASDYYALSRENESVLDACGVRKMSESTRLMMSSIDYAFAKNAREKNYHTLSEALDRHNRIAVKNNAGLFFYPLYVENGWEIKNWLNSNKVYTPTFWPELIDSPDPFLAELVKNIVPVPMDHRYGTKDMQYIIDLIQKKTGV